jgi:excisionase family DNA binding protein
MQTTIAPNLNTRSPLTVTAAAPILGAHPETVRRHLRAGNIRGIRLGHWRIPADEIDRLEGRIWDQQGEGLE